MPYYRYRAVDREGRPAVGHLDASNEVDLELRLKRLGLDLITLRELETRLRRWRRGSITRRDLITFCIHMRQITDAGIPIFDGVRDLRDSMDNPRFREVLTVVLEDMEGGKLLSQALAAHAEVFDEVFVSLVRAGELTGILGDVFANLSESLKWQEDLAAQTKRLLVYPALVLVVVGAVILYLLVYLVPQLAGLMENFRMALPWQTKLLIAVTDFLRHFWPVPIGLVIAGVLAYPIATRKSARVRLMVDRAKLEFPLVGSVLQKIVLARVANTFATLYRAGITVLEAIDACEGIAGNRVIAEGLKRARERIAAGDGLTESFRNLGLFPPLVIRMLRVGETTGALDEALSNVSYFYNREVRESVDAALKLLEPALTIILGLTLATIIYAVFSPMYDIIGNLKL
jgi:type IV pilus assembly protein PilC